MIKHPPQKITFVTGNPGKAATARQYFDELGVVLSIYPHDLAEPRSDDIAQIAAYKVKQAYELVGGPCIAQDSGFYIDALCGFPKAYVHFALDTIGIPGLIKLMEGERDRACAFKECLAYYDGGEVRFFFSEHRGRLATEPLGMDNPEKWSELWYVFIPDYDLAGRTLAQYTPEETNARRSRVDSSIKRFAQWYKAAYSL